MGSRILIVDDNSELRALLSARLKAAGYEVITAASGDEALDQVSAKRPDLILLDIMMPGMNGEEVLKRINSDPSVGFTPVIFLTAKDTVVDGLDMGAMDFIKKPFDSEELLARIRAQLRIKQLQDELSRLSATDYLTGCFNRLHALTILDIEIKKSKRYGIPLTCVMVDIDGFKGLNDRHGHDFGDYVLRQVASLLCESLREVDTVSRYGGDEFLLVMPYTSPDGARSVCRRMRRLFNATAFSQGVASERIGASFGIASASDEGVKDAASLITLADLALYHAKSHGGISLSSDVNPAGEGGEARTAT